jgi:hypothetical protein
MIHFQVEMQDLTEIESALGMMKDKSKMVLRTAINNTAKQTVTLLVNEANRQYYIGKSKVKKTITTKKATAGKLEAIITSQEPVKELYDFKVRPKAYNPRNRPKAGHTGNVRRDKKASRLYLKPGESGDKYKAFVVKYKSGHITIGQRVPGKKMKSDPTKEFVKTLLSPSTPNMLGYEQGVYGVVEPQMYDLLQKNIQEQILRYTAK